VKRKKYLFVCLTTWVFVVVPGTNIITEFVVHLGPTQPVVSPVPPRAGIAVAHAESNPSSDWVTALLARPLFEPGRRPATEASQPAEQLPAPPRLAGILIAPGYSAAIFEAASGRRAITVQTGARLQGWDVQDITHASVTLTQGSQALVMRPQFATDKDTPQQSDNETASSWRVGQRRSGQLPNYLQRRR